MRAVRLSFMQMIRFMAADMMLLAAAASPVLMGFAIGFGIPCIERTLVNFAGLPYVLSPYYGLLDILFAAITPAMFCFVAAMVMLEEHDDHIDRYLFVTKLGKKGYYISRIILPAMLGFTITCVILPIFGLTKISVIKVLFLSLSGTLQGVIIGMLVVNLSSNKLEGMALTKLASLLMFGAAGAYFLETPYSYLLFFMPSYWTGMVVTCDNLLYMIPTVLVSAVWILLLLRPQAFVAMTRLPHYKEIR